MVPGMTFMESLAFLSVTPQARGAEVLQQLEEQGWGPLGAFSGEKAPKGRLGLLQKPSGQPRGPEVSFPEGKHCRVVKDGLIFDSSQSWRGVW